MRELALFDLDETLIAGDSDFEWGQFLIDTGVLDRAVYEARNEEFYAQYRDGTLDVAEYLDFAVRPLSRYSSAQLNAWHSEFLQSRILPLVRPGARPLLARYERATRAIVTATNAFVTRPIAAALGVPHLLATDLEEVDGRFTGRSRGTPCFQHGKVTRLHDWLASRDERLEDYDRSWFFSDSINDLPLLSIVTNPVTVHPDPRLRAHAIQAGWPVITLDDDESG